MLLSKLNLNIRMALVMILLGLVYILFISVLSLYLTVSYISVIIGFILISLLQYYYAKKIALKGMNAQIVSETEYPNLHSSVNRLSKQADVKKPDVAISKTKVPNAFAAGRSPNDAVVCVTEGLLNKLDEDELEAVIAHELAHIKNRDVAVMTLASLFSGIAFMIVRYGIYFNSNQNKGIIVAMVVSLLVWVVSFICLRVLSQYREYAADKGAAEITGKPYALASALRTISSEIESTPEKDLRESSNSGLKALYIFEIDSSRFTKFLRTHPPAEKRIEKLQELEKSD